MYFGDIIGSLRCRRILNVGDYLLLNLGDPLALLNYLSELGG